MDQRANFQRSANNVGINVERKAKWNICTERKDRCGFPALRIRRRRLAPKLLRYDVDVDDVDMRGTVSWIYTPVPPHTPARYSTIQGCWRSGRPMCMLMRMHMGFGVCYVRIGAGVHLKWCCGGGSSRGGAHVTKEAGILEEAED